MISTDEWNERFVYDIVYLMDIENHLESPTVQNTYETGLYLWPGKGGLS